MVSRTEILRVRVTFGVSLMAYSEKLISRSDLTIGKWLHAYAFIRGPRYRIICITEFQFPFGYWFEFSDYAPSPKELNDKRVPIAEYAEHKVS